MTLAFGIESALFKAKKKEVAPYLLLQVMLILVFTSGSNVFYFFSSDNSQ